MSEISSPDALGRRKAVILSVGDCGGSPWSQNPFMNSIARASRYDLIGISVDQALRGARLATVVEGNTSCHRRSETLISLEIKRNSLELVCRVVVYTPNNARVPVRRYRQPWAIRRGG